MNTLANSVVTVEAETFALTLEDLSEYLVEDRKKLGISDPAIALITQHLQKAAELIRAVNEEREKALEDLAELENDLEEVNVDNYLVAQAYEAGREVGAEEGYEQAEIEVWDDNMISFEDMREVLAFHLNTTEYDRSVSALVDGLTDRLMFANDLKAQAALAMLAREVLGDDFFKGGNTHDE